MGGRSGSVPAAHTPIALLGDKRFAISEAGARLIAKALASGDTAVFMYGAEKRTGQALIACGLGRAADDREMFVLTKGVRLEPTFSGGSESDPWQHKDGSAHSAAGPLGCFPCANERRKSTGGSDA